MVVPSHVLNVHGDAPWKHGRFSLFDEEETTAGNFPRSPISKNWVRFFSVL
jgi:hypothetical protein